MKSKHKCSPFKLSADHKYLICMKCREWQAIRVTPVEKDGVREEK